MPEQGHLLSQSRSYRNTRFNWNQSQGSWVFGQTNSFSVNTLYDYVARATKRPKPPPRAFKPPSRYERDIIRVSPRSGYRLTTVSGVNFYLDTGYLSVPWPSLPSAVPSNVRNAMQFKVLDKVRQQKMDLGTTIAELPKTMRMVASTVTDIANSIRYARRGNFRRAFESVGLDTSLVKDVSKRWLALQYGWTPLMSDVESACLVLSEGLGDWRYGAKYETNYSYGFTPNPNYMVSRTGKRQLKVRLDFKVDNSKAMTYSQLGLTNPVAIAWELIPFSFVADWFVPIGSWLENLHLGMFSTFLGGSFTDFYHIYDEFHGERNSSPPWLTVGDYGGTREVVSIKREVLSSYLPTLIPKPDFSLSLKQMASGLSLLQEVVVRGKR